MSFFFFFLPIQMMNWFLLSKLANRMPFDSAAFSSILSHEIILTQWFVKQNIYNFVLGETVKKVQENF